MVGSRKESIHSGWLVTYLPVALKATAYLHLVVYLIVSAGFMDKLHVLFNWFVSRCLDA